MIIHRNLSKMKNKISQPVYKETIERERVQENSTIRAMSVWGSEG